jgi:hypothetical protein
MHLAEQPDPEMAAGLRRLRAATQQHCDALLEMLVKSDPYALGRDATAALEQAHALDPTRLQVTERLTAASATSPVAAGG